MGTRLAADNHSCEDVDECAQNNAGCSHTCLNTLGRAFCLCPIGFMLGADWKTCYGKKRCHILVLIHLPSIWVHNNMCIVFLGFGLDITYNNNDIQPIQFPISYF